MDGILNWKDGRKQQILNAGGIRHYVPWFKDGHHFETAFDCRDISYRKGDPLVYDEAETIDITAKMQEAAERNRQRTIGVVRRGLSVSDDEITALRSVADAARNVVAQWRGDISRKPMIGQLRDALKKLDEAT